MPKLKTTTELKEYITNNLTFDNNRGCLIWNLYKDKKGYGKTMIKGKTALIHRVIWELVNGPIPELFEGKKSFICHKCDNPPCCNPAHLFLGNEEENNKDKITKNRHFKPNGILNHFHTLNENDVLEIRKIREEMNYTYDEIGKLYNVTKSCIHAIIKGKTWKHI